MKVIVRSYGDMKRLLGAKSAIVLKDKAKIRDLILALGGKVSTSKIAYLGGHRVEDSNMIILVNGRNIHALDDYETTLKEDDLITFVPVLIGG